MRFVLGLITGLCLASVAANAGIISHVAAYEVGKSVGKGEANPCPNVAPKPEQSK